MYLLSVALLLIPLAVLTAFLVLYCASMSFHLFSTLHHKRAPFVPSSRRMIDRLPDLINLNATSIVYDLGCGDGRILRSLHRRFPAARYIGIENDLYPYLLSRIFNWNIPSRQIVIKRKNFFAEDLSSATHIIMYLFPEVMDRLLPELEKELRPGTILVSFDFSFSHKKPEHIIETPELGRHRMFAYRF
jgi:trans-aconitate methyltransferase